MKNKVFKAPGILINGVNDHKTLSENELLEALTSGSDIFEKLDSNIFNAYCEKRQLLDENKLKEH